jgi:hypothetical protein
MQAKRNAQEAIVKKPAVSEASDGKEKAAEGEAQNPPQQL